MFDRLFADLAGHFGAVFVAAEAVVPGAAQYDAGGSIIAPAEPTRRPCRVQVDAATQAMRQADGFLETDVRLLVLSLDGPLTTAARIVVNGASYALLSVSRDPAGVGWECRGRSG